MSKSRSEKTSWFRRWPFRATLSLVLVALFLGGIIWIGHRGLEQLQGRDRYLLDFRDIECEPPVGMDKREFLDEVLFESRLPKRLNLLDADLPQHLREGFLKHPWVERVEVDIKPPKQIIVILTHRTPVLAVKVGAKVFAVDANGVLLRPNAPTLSLPIYDGDAKPPQGPAGTRWGDPNVEAAARMLRK
jgi:cell division septal protein FtsQ